MTDETDKSDDDHGPRRFKNPDELSVEEIVQQADARKRGDDLKFETVEYLDARHRALVDAGLEDTNDQRPPTAEEWETASADDHLKAMRKDRP